MEPSTVAILGLIALVVGLMLGAMVGEVSLASYLVTKAKPKYRTPAKLGDGSYYIVPADEYVDGGYGIT